MKIHLVRDCLDKQVVDSRGRKIGRVDGIVIEAGGRGRPRVAAIEIGSAVLASRMPANITKVVNWLFRRISSSAENKMTVPIDKLEVGGKEVRVAIYSDSTEARALENWLRNKIIIRIPGA